MRKYCLIAVFFIVIIASMSCDAKVIGFSLHPASHDFGTVNLGDMKLMHFRVKNQSNETYIISKIQLMGVSASNFRITAGYAVPKYMQSQAYVIISVEYEPQNAGLHVAFIQITHSGPKINERIDLLGTGFPVARMNINSENIDFGIVYVTRSGVEEIVLENVGTDRLIISSLNFEKPAVTEFTIKSGGAIPIMIDAGATHTIEVEMTPPADSNYSNVLLISHNAVDRNSPVRVILQGEGVTYAPEMDLNQTSPWDIGSVAKTMPGIFMLEIESVGNDDLTLTSFSLQKGTEFTYEGLEDSNGNDLNLPQVVLIGDTVFAKIGFAPSANTTYNDTLSIIHDAINHNIPLEIELAGEGRDEITKTFLYTGAVEQWTVPAGVTRILVECKGAEGGNSHPYNAGHLRGEGGMSKAKVPVTPGSTIDFNVGGEGGNASVGTGGTGGFNGGGRGGTIWGNYAGGGGGGASDIRIGGTALTDRKVVGAGGGGAGYDYSSGDNGGAGGDLTGQDGAAGGSVGHMKAGKGGTQTAGGAAGGPYSSYGSGFPGTLGVGGNGGDGGSGAGGGGYYGGGGSIWAGGGGGSSYYDAAGNTDKSTQMGVRSGNGEIVIKY